MSKKLNYLIKDYPNFPKGGIVFKDILPILQNPDEFSLLIKDMSENKICKEADAIVAIDARGFIFGTAISIALSKPMIVARKPGKLPGELITKSYALEYGLNNLSIQIKSIEKYESFVIVDDLLATGGTALCVANILQDKKKEITGLSVVVELSKLSAKDKLPFPVDSQIIF